MATETRYLYNDEDLSRFANQVKEMLVVALGNQGVLTDEEGMEFLENYAVIVTKKGWLGSTIDKVLGLKELDDKKIQLIKIV